MLKYISILLLLLFVTGCSLFSNQEVINTSPAGKIIIGDTEYEMKIGNYRWESKRGTNSTVITTDAASPNQIAEEFEPIKVAKNSKIELSVTENPSILNVELWDKNAVVGTVELKDKQLIAPSDSGTYIYEVDAKWPNGEVSYTFVIEVE